MITVEIKIYFICSALAGSLHCFTFNQPNDYSRDLFDSVVETHWDKAAVSQRSRTGSFEEHTSPFDVNMLALCCVTKFLVHSQRTASVMSILSHPEIGLKYFCFLGKCLKKGKSLLCHLRLVYRDFIHEIWEGYMGLAARTTSHVYKFWMSRDPSKFRDIIYAWRWF